jgi:hypothetical protein
MVPWLLSTGSVPRIMTPRGVAPDSAGIVPEPQRFGAPERP